MTSSSSKDNRKNKQSTSSSAIKNKAPAKALDLIKEGMAEKKKKERQENFSSVSMPSSEPQTASAGSSLRSAGPQTASAGSSSSSSALPPAASNSSNSSNLPIDVDEFVDYNEDIEEDEADDDGSATWDDLKQDRLTQAAKEENAQKDRLRTLCVSPASTVTGDYEGDSVEEQRQAKDAAQKKKRRGRRKEQLRRFNTLYAKFSNDERLRYMIDWEVLAENFIEVTDKLEVLEKERRDYHERDMAAKDDRATAAEELVQARKQVDNYKRQLACQETKEPRKNAMPYSASNKKS